MSDGLAKQVRPIEAIFVDNSVTASGDLTFKSSYVDLLKMTHIQAEKIEQLDAELADAKNKLSTIKEKQREIIKSAVETACEEQRTKFEKDTQRIVEAGLASLELGLQVYEEFLGNTENLTLHLLEFALEPLFCDPAHVRDTLTGTIVKSIEDIGASSVLNVRLNSSDFGNPSELLDVESHLKARNFSFEIDPMLESGECVFELLIGQYEISLPRHWELLKSSFKESLFSDSAHTAVQKT